MTALARAVTKLHVRLYRALDGRFVSRGPGGVPLLLLTTTGRRSGQSRTVPVGYVGRGEDLLISPGSTPAPAPGWLRNLKAGPIFRLGERSPQARRSPVVVRLRVHSVHTHHPSDVRRRPS